MYLYRLIIYNYVIDQMSFKGLCVHKSIDYHVLN